ncbi:MAG: sel1 repeat family protein, partial [Hyphomicrobiales bacterium]
MRIRGLVFACALIVATGSALAVQRTGSMPDMATQYHKRMNCHGAYDVLIEDSKTGRQVSAEDRAFGKAYEDNAANGIACPQASAALLARAADHVVVTDDGLAKLASYHKLKDASAYFEAAYSVLTGKTKIVGPEVGWELLNQANILGSPEANYFSGALYAAGTIGGKVNYPEAFKHMKIAADAGHLDAIFQVGNFYAAGLSVKKDPKIAFDYYGKAAAQGHVFATYLAASMANGDQGIKADHDLAYRLGRNLADQGEVSGAVIAASALLQMKDARTHEDEVLYWMDVAIRDGDTKIKDEIGKIRPRVIAAFKRANAPPEYHPRVRKACPTKTVCLVDRFTGARQ